MKVLLAYAAPVEGHDVAARFPEAVEIGVGKASAAGSVAMALTRQPAAAVLLFGVCGAYPSGHLSAGESLGVGDLCLVSEDVMGDEGKATEEGFRTLDGEGAGQTGPFPADVMLTARAAELLGGLPLVRGATVSTCSGTAAASMVMARRTGAQVETMEGAAVATACQRLGVPLVQMRCVSNHAGDPGSWQLEMAARRVQEAVLDLLTRDWP